MKRAVTEELDSFYLKKSEGTVYGPVSMADLQGWAREGRIAPDDVISLDRHKWKPAPSLAELEMFWTVTLEDGGEIGPMHLDAVKELVEQKVMGEDGRVKDGRTGQAMTLSEAFSAMERKAGPVLSVTPQKEPERVKLAEVKESPVAAAVPVAAKRQFVLTKARPEAMPAPAAAPVPAAEPANGGDLAAQVAAERDKIDAGWSNRMDRLKREKAALKEEVGQLRKRVAELEKAQAGAVHQPKKNGKNGGSDKGMSTVVRAAAARLTSEAFARRHKQGPVSSAPGPSRKGVSSASIRRGPMRGS